MAKVRTLSRFFPKGHINEKEPTYFVEKVLFSLGKDYKSNGFLLELIELNKEAIFLGKITEQQVINFFESLVEISEEKRHTIRMGKLIKDGDKISLRVWSKKPYHSTQIIIHPDIPVYTRTFKKQGNDIYVDGIKLTENGISNLAKWDGLTYNSLYSWFKVDFVGQVIIWK